MLDCEGIGVIFTILPGCASIKVGLAVDGKRYYCISD